MSAPPLRRRARSWLVIALPVMILIVGFSLTLAAAASTRSDARQRRLDRFDTETTKVIESYQAAIRKYAELPDRTHNALFLNGGEALSSAADFALRTSGWGSQNTYPAMYGVAWAEPIKFQAFSDRAEPLEPGFKPPQGDPDALVVTRGSPDTTMKVALGINPHLFAPISSALDKAILTRSPAASEPFHLPVVDTNSQALQPRVLFILAPYFHQIFGVDQLRGAATAIIDFDRFVELDGGNLASRYSISVSTGSVQGVARNGYEAKPDSPQRTETVTVADTIWTFSLQESEQTFFGERDNSVGVLQAGFAATLLVFAIVFMLARLERRSDKLVQRATHELSHRASHDSLTGLVNRAQFIASLEQHIAANEHPGVIFVDLDRFKSINDTYGHRVGDVVLIEVAQRIERELRAHDTAARLGGDEFVVVVPEASMDHLHSIAERIEMSTAEPIAVDNLHLFVGASVGIAPWREGIDADGLTRDADVAMYNAKKSGKGCIAIFAEEHEDSPGLHLRLARDLGSALNRDEIQVAYQPIVDLATNEFVGVEALARWNHPELGQISPAVFVGVASQIGRMDELGRQVMATCLSDRVAWQETLGDAAPWVSVNLSPNQLKDRLFTDDISAMFHESGVSTHTFTFEVSESLAMGDLSVSLRQLGGLRKIGCSIAIDDFGSGMSNLTQLRQLPVNQLKIDPDLIRRLGTSEIDDNIVKLIRELSGVLAMDCVAKGVETPLQQRALRDLGCRYGQGWLFGRPTTADRIERLITMTTQLVS